MNRMRVWPSMASKREENTQYIARERMYSAMRSTSALYPSYPCHNKQSSDEKPQPGFGEHDHDQFNGQLHSAMNPSYSTPPSYPMHQNQNHGFGVQKTLMANNGPFYNPVQNPSYSTPASYPTNQNQNYGSGVQQNLMRNRPPVNNPSYSTLASYMMHQNQNYGFGMKQSSMTNEGPFNHPGFNLPYPAQETLTYPVGQPAAIQAQEAPIYMVRRPAAAKEQAQQVEVKRNAEEGVLDVTLEPPIFPLGKPRLRWTLELHERFIRAATQLGGVFKATPKAILGRMNVRGLTLEHLKSHLQKARLGKLHNISVEEITGHGIQNNANSSASSSTEVEASSSYRPNYESATARNETLLRTSETLNYHQNRMIALFEDHAN